ncbi:ABC transporter substrate-binding protein [Actinokineospora pegani]|uniref:ABC transporter substrate-binding protein n=1 Tax=Actinokineospora pegani TaxID=2654637 RepID=UPI0012E9EE82|nr:ABC transporter substrate-binding protein [Actinokineospora pegani]
MTLPRLSVLAAVAALLVGCGATVEPTAAGPSGSTSTAEVTNCGQKVDYPTPQRAVAYDVSGVEKMFALGLAPRMRGYVMNSLGDPSIAGSDYKDDYAEVERLGSGRISREVVVGAKADWVIAGWNGGFSEARGITPKLLEQVGVNSYVHTETCWAFPDGDKQQPAPLEALYTDLLNLGGIFGVQDRAKSLVEELRGRADKVRESAPPADERARVWVYDSGNDQPFTAGKHAAPTDVIDVAGGKNAFADLEKGWSTVGWESVVEADPEVIIVVDYADQPATEKINFLKALPQLANTPAVKENRFHVLSYGDMVSGPRNIRAAESIAGYLRSIGR